MSDNTSNNINNTGNTKQTGGNFDSNNAKVNPRMFAALTSGARHVIARSAHSDTLEVGGYDPEISLKLSIASAQNDNFKSRTLLNSIAKELLTSYGEEFELDIENAYYNFKNGLPNVKGLENAVLFMGCIYRGEKMGRLKIFNTKKLAKKERAIIKEDLDNQTENEDNLTPEEAEEDEVIAILAGDDAKYELKHRTELYYDTVSRTIPDENKVLDEYKSDIN